MSGKAGSIRTLASLMIIAWLFTGCCSQTADFGGVSTAHEGKIRVKRRLEKPAPKPEETPKGMVALTMADLGLEEMDPGGDLYSDDLYPFQEEPVYYGSINNPKYDTFFKDSAVIYGSALLGRKIADAVESQNEDVLMKYSLNPSPPIFKAESPLYTFGTETLPQSKTRAESLIKDGNELLNQVEQDFTGLKARFIPRVTEGITESLDQLQGSVDVLEDLASRLNAR